MDGLGWMIKSLLDSQGIKIDKQEISQVVETAKVLIPRIAEQFATMQATLERIEARQLSMTEVRSKIDGRNDDHHSGQ
jgi:hypothetical protein